MKDRDRRLELLSLNVSDGIDPDWETLAEATGDESERKEIGDLRSLSLIAGFYRQRRREDRTAGVEPGTLWGHLEILEPVGQGSHAEVYRARDTQLNREVALKLIRGAGDRGAPPTLTLEGERLARVKHPNLVVIHGAESRGGDLGLWMEFIRGTTLHDLIQSQGPLSGREAILLGVDLCGALAALHAAGLLHRDIKAHNVMREEGGRVVLMDLGAGTDIDERTQSLSVSGTPLYMAPEILAGGSGDVRADIYSLGVLLFYAVTGKYPVWADTVDGLRRRHACGERRRLRDVRPNLPAAFVACVERAIAPDPGGRYASVGEMEQALSTASGIAASRGAGRAAVRGKADSTWRRIFSRRRTTIAALASGAAAVGIVLFLWPGLLVASHYTVDATLHRVADGAHAQLLPGARVSPGDRLYLEFEASRALHVYVLAEDDRGAAFLLFPLPGQATGNPLPGDMLHRLPPDLHGRRYTWGVSSAGGTEHLLIVASPDALTDFESTLAALPAPQVTGGASALPLDREALSGLRGIGHLLETEPSADPESARPAFSLARRLAGGPERNRGIWVRQIDLVNPGR